MSKISMLLENFITDCQFKHIRPKTIKNYDFERPQYQTLKNTKKKAIR